MRPCAARRTRSPTAKVSICPSAAGCGAGGAGHKYVVDGNKLAGSQRVATRRPMEETRKSWLRFAELHALPSSWAISVEPKENWFGCPVRIVKALYGVLRSLPASGRAVNLLAQILFTAGVDSGGSASSESPCGIAATAVGLALDGVRRELRIQQRAVGGIQLETGDRVAQESWLCKGTGSTRDRCRWRPAACQWCRCPRTARSEHSIADRVGGHVGVQRIGDIGIFAGAHRRQLPKAHCLSERAAGDGVRTPELTE